MHTIAILALHGVVPFDLATPCEVFNRVQLPTLQPAYQIAVCGEARDIKTDAFDIRVQWDFRYLANAQTVIVPGVRNPTRPIADEVLDTLRLAAVNGARIRRAQQLLETTSPSIEQVATAAGFDSAITFRERFRRIVGTHPQAYRRAFSHEMLPME